MKSRLAGVLFTILALSTPACNSAMETPDIKLNPHPKMRYEITMTIDDAPGPFDSVAAFAQYKVDNDRCVPLQPISGATVAPQKSVPIELNAVGHNVYRGYIYLDLLQDEDYYSLGICHWTVVAATAVLKTKDLGFSPDIFKAELLAQQSATRYFSKKQFSSAEEGKAAATVSAGVLASEYQRFLPEWKKDMFSVTLGAKEAFE